MAAELPSDACLPAGPSMGPLVKARMHALSRCSTYAVKQGNYIMGIYPRYPGLSKISALAHHLKAFNMGRSYS